METGEWSIEKVRRMCPQDRQYSKLSTIWPLCRSCIPYNCMRVSILIRGDWHTECNAETALPWV